MPINTYENREIETSWELGEGWYYRIDLDWYGPFNSEEEAIRAVEYRIDLEDWE